MRQKINKYDKQYTDYQLKKRNKLRQWVRNIYLKKTLSLAIGPTIDFGCGPGELLEQLPENSIGFDINPVTVEYCMGKGLSVQHYDPERDQYQLESIQPGVFHTFLMNHVLEHLSEPDRVLKKLLPRLYQLGIKRVVIIVPGKKGFSHDKTHVTFIDKPYLVEHNLISCAGFKVSSLTYFPVNWKWLEKLYTFLELHIVYDLIRDEC